MKILFKGIISLFITVFISTVIFVNSNKIGTATDLILNKAIKESPEVAFKIWQYVYNKSKDYEQNSFEYQRKLYNFRKKLEEIKRFNMDPTKTWKKGLNQFSDLTDEEFANKYLMKTTPIPNEKSDYYNANGFIFQDLLVDRTPVSQFEPVDWSYTSGPARDQKECGSCYSFATLNAIESNYFIKTGKSISLSRQQIVDCNPTTKGCDGGWAPPVGIYAKGNGLMSEEDYPYEAAVGECRYDANKTGDYVSGMVGHVIVRNYSSLRVYPAAYLYSLLKKGPTVVAIDGDALKDYNSGVFQVEGCFNMNHAVLATGFGISSQGKPYFIIKNSWGANWGENGYIRIEARDSDSTGNCFLYYYPYRPFYLDN